MSESVIWIRGKKYRVVGHEAGQKKNSSKLKCQVIVEAHYHEYRRVLDKMKILSISVMDLEMFHLKDVHIKTPAVKIKFFHVPACVHAQERERELWDLLKG